MGKKGLVTAISSMAALGLILIAGLYGWTEIVVASFNRIGSLSLPMLLGFGFLAGMFSFFAPCAFVLFPGYISYYLSQAGRREGGQDRIAQSMIIGSISGLGAIFFFTLLGIVVSLLGSSFSHYLIRIKPLIALYIVLLGTLLLADISLDLSRIKKRFSVHFSGRQKNSQVSQSHFFLYGFGYGLATTACTFPLFLSLVIVPITSGHFVTGLLAFMSFASAMGLLMVVATLLIGFSKGALIGRLMASTLWIKRISGLILVLVGLYLGYFFIRAGM